MKTCAWCGQAIKDKRSGELSRRFQAHCTHMTRELHGQRSRRWVHDMCLLKAVEIAPPQGGEPYPYEIVQQKVDGRVVDVVSPFPSSEASNKQLLTACEAQHMLAAEWGVGPLPEKPPEEGMY